jgi:hypothetical protein
MSTAPPVAAPDPAAARPRRRIQTRTRLDFTLDALILAGYLLAYSFGFTGLVIHEWLGLALGLVLLIHLTLHWDWVLRTTRRLTARSGYDQLIWLVNLALLVAMALCVASGVLISRVALPALGLFPGGNGFWSGLHDTTAAATLGLVPVHVALRWRWIVRVARRMLAWRPAGGAR